MVTADQLALQLRQKQMEQENNLALEERKPTGLFDPFLHETVRHALTEIALYILTSPSHVSTSSSSNYNSDEQYAQRPYPKKKKTPT